MGTNIPQINLTISVNIMTKDNMISYIHKYNLNNSANLNNLYNYITDKVLIDTIVRSFI